LIIAAAAADVVDYSQFSPSRQWFTQENLLLAAYEQQQFAAAWRAKLDFRLSGRFPTDEAAQSAQEALSNTVSSLLPWVVNEDDLGTADDRIDHMIADWYRYFAGDQLEELLRNRNADT